MHSWRERLNLLLLPMARRAPFSPNSVTLFAAFLNLIAAFLLGLGGSRPGVYLGAGFLVGFSGLLDAFDGAIARAQQKESRFGDFLDHFLDRVSDAAILIGWCIGMMVRPALALPAVAGVLLVGYLGTQIEATFQRRSYEGTGRAEFVVGMMGFALVGYFHSAGFLRFRLAGLSIAEVMVVALLMMIGLTALQRLRQARSLGREVSR